MKKVLCFCVLIVLCATFLQCFAGVGTGSHCAPPNRVGAYNTADLGAYTANIGAYTANMGVYSACGGPSVVPIGAYTANLGAYTANIGAYYACGGIYLPARIQEGGAYNNACGGSYGACFGARAHAPASIQCGGAQKGCTDISDFLDGIAGLFGGGSSSQIDEKVYLGGYPLGITIDGDGVTVVGLNEFINAKGDLCCPALACGIEINDVIVELDGKKIYNSARLAEIAAMSCGRALAITYVRNGQTKQAQIVPQSDLSAGQFRLGLWTRDSSSGIGTLTYVRKNMKFGSLGHPITDPTGKVVPCKNGGVFGCEINGVEKGRRGAAGELKGTFAFDKRIGNLYLNNKYGAFGTFNTLPSFCESLVPVADVSEVSIGKAEIYCTLDGNTRQSYEIEIVKAARQTSKNDRGLVVHVTDARLLEKTGGIVQGMSGSPIVQNGKLVGAVTHVFVNDPTRGYGIYAKWMLEN